VWIYDWESGALVQQIDVAPEAAYWSDNGDLLALCCTDTFYVLKADGDAISEALASGALDEEDGVDGAFELVHEVRPVKNNVTTRGSTTNTFQPTKSKQ
jgi:coatomer subunit beta'